jgi:outer membrane biosynthesis protein TonB
MSARAATLGARARPGEFPQGGGLPLSILLHGGLLTLGLIAWRNDPPRLAPDPAIPVEIVSDAASGFGEATAQDSPMTGAEPASDGAAAPEPAPSTEPEPAAAAEPSPAPSPPSPAPPAPAPAPPPPPPPPPKAKSAPPQPPPPTKGAVAAKSPPPPAARAPAAKSPPAKAPPPPAARPAKAATGAAPPPEFDLAAATAAASGANSGGRRPPKLSTGGAANKAGRPGGGVRLTGRLEDALRGQISPCWLEPADLSNPARLVVELDIELDVDGRLIREPTLVRPASRAGADPTLQVAIDNAFRAVRQCAPFDLPPEQHATWRSVRFTFDPRRMAAP